ncbi:phosphatase PAP2 family protein [Nocardioides sp. J9]|uniref:phosphatase PAP2 family protein n=1 Tax=Nocardioides sp. J9 TaxID=935844 RepID=UPI0021BD1D01|nr:phosphatase PAP2 family protein [Nocardioides sp. J9]
MYRRATALLVSTAVLMWVTTYVVGLRYDQAPVEPEGKMLGPSLTMALDLLDVDVSSITLLSLILVVDVVIRSFTILLAGLAIDLGVRGLWQSWRRRRRFKEVVAERFRDHWTRGRMRLVVVGTLCFYVTYVCYRNLKSFLPFVRSDPDAPPGEVRALSYDRELHLVDRVLFFGHDPSDVLHGLLGTNVAAHFLSQVYLAYLPMVVTLVLVWLVWSRTLSFGYWFVCAQVLGWSLGTLSYYLLPTLGPGIAYWPRYTKLAHTPTTDLMDGITNARGRYLYDDSVEGILNSVAGFASLHVAISLLWVLAIQYTLRSRKLTIFGWIFFACTVVATLYFGWHYVADDVAGVSIAVVSFYVGGLAAGQRFTRRPRGGATASEDGADGGDGDAEAEPAATAPAS